MGRADAVAAEIADGHRSTADSLVAAATSTPITDERLGRSAEPIALISNDRTILTCSGDGDHVEPTGGWQGLAAAVPLPRDRLPPPGDEETPMSGLIAAVAVLLLIAAIVGVKVLVATLIVRCWHDRERGR